MSFISELNAGQRADVARLIGSTLPRVGPTDAQQTGELWLRDAEITSWRIQLASHQEAPKASAVFFHAWRNA